MTPSERMIDSVVKPIENAGLNVTEGNLYATHEGVIDIGGAKLKCYVLNDGRRILDWDDVCNFLSLIEK